MLLHSVYSQKLRVTTNCVNKKLELEEDEYICKLSTVIVSFNSEAQKFLGNIMNCNFVDGLITFSHKVGTQIPFHSEINGLKV